MVRYEMRKGKRDGAGGSYKEVGRDFLYGKP